jgi:hypothetical protein
MSKLIPYRLNEIQLQRTSGALTTQAPITAATCTVDGPATCYVVGGGWIAILLFYALIGAVVVSGAVYKLRAFR